MSPSPESPSLRGFSAETFQRRRRRVFETLGDGALVLPGASVRFSSRDTEYPFRPDSELFYVTGMDEPESVAVLRGQAEDERFALFVRSRDAKAELWSGPRFGPAQAKERLFADAAYPLEELDERLPRLLEGASVVYHRLGRAGQVQADDRVERLVLAALRHGRLRGPRTGVGPRGVLDPGQLLDELRLLKDEEELACMRRAAGITGEAFRAAMGRVASGVGEWELQALVDFTFRRAGADGPGYPTIVGSGSNACVLHYVENSRTVQDGDLVLVDAGAAVSLYCADVTRTFPVRGTFAPEQRAVYEVVEEARLRAVQAVRPGATVAQVHDAAVRALTEGLVELGALAGSAEQLIEEKKHEAFYPHRTSHWLGLDVHDVGDYAHAGESRVLRAGMVLTIEPGLYFSPAAEGAPASLLGLGVRIEDDVLVTEQGNEVLTACLPTAAGEVEALVRRGREG